MHTYIVSTLLGVQGIMLIQSPFIAIMAKSKKKLTQSSSTGKGKLIRPDLSMCPSCIERNA